MPDYAVYLQPGNVPHFGAIVGAARRKAEAPVVRANLHWVRGLQLLQLGVTAVFCLFVDGMGWELLNDMVR